MSDDKTLICTNCDSLVVSCLGHDGYHGRCDCDIYYFQSSQRKRPMSWERVGDLSEPSNFTLYCENDLRGVGSEASVVVSPYVVCCRCDDDGDIDIETENVGHGEGDLKATFTCKNGHYRDDRELTAIAYYDSESRKGQAILGCIQDD